MKSKWVYIVAEGNRRLRKRKGKWGINLLFQYLVLHLVTDLLTWWKISSQCMGLISTSICRNLLHKCIEQHAPRSLLLTVILDSLFQQLVLAEDLSAHCPLLQVEWLPHNQRSNTWEKTPAFLLQLPFSASSSKC